MVKLGLPWKPLAFLRLGLDVGYGKPANERCFSSEVKAFKSLYHPSPSTCSLVWAKLQQKKIVPRAKAYHLLWALAWLKTYATDKALSEMFNVHEDTFREWSFALVEAIAMLKPDYVRMTHKQILVSMKLTSCYLTSIDTIRSNGAIATNSTGAQGSKQKFQLMEQIS